MGQHFEQVPRKMAVLVSSGGKIRTGPVELRQRPDLDCNDRRLSTQTVFFVRWISASHFDEINAHVLLPV